MKKTMRSPLLCLVTAILFWSCATVPLTGRKQMDAIPDSQLIPMSFSNYQEVISSSRLSSDAEKTKMIKEGWTAELKIPFSQLRFAYKKNLVWGIQLNRRLFRKEERSHWQAIPGDAPGWVHLFGELHGLEGIKPQKQIELTPYLVSKLETFEKIEGDPFASGHSTSISGGLDGKIGLTSDLTLDFTINPDFGQVEADPSEVNLTTFETYFSEQRPFFIEGKNILNFRITNKSSEFYSDNLFYSRRIGRPPQFRPAIAGHEYIDMPMTTNIIAAAKVTGKTKNGWSIAILESMTSKENAEIDSNGDRRHEAVEPFSNFFTLRLQKDYRNGDTRIGGMFTAANRKIDDPGIDFLHSAAYTGGIDFDHSWKNKTYYISVKTIFSHVRGSQNAILSTQLSPLRYYQRPDADHISVDPTRTSLTGHGGTVTAGKEGKGHIRYSAGLTWRSPGLELNDIGYLRTADRFMEWLWLGYRIWKPFSIFRSVNIGFNQKKGWDFGGTNLFDRASLGFDIVFKNFWTLSTSFQRNFEGLSTTELRGGPALAWPAEWTNSFTLITDSRKKVFFLLYGDNAWGDNNVFRTESYTGEVVFRPTNALQLRLGSTLSWNRRELQYVNTVDYNNESRYLFAELNQKTVAFTIRLNFTLSPDLTIEFYGQPFISAGKYSNFKRITNPRADIFSDRFHVFSGNEINYNPDDGIYYFDENGDGHTDYATMQPNFNFLEFLSNLVVRWEYKPGCTLYLVWSQGRTGIFNSGDFSFSNDMKDLFHVPPHDVFLLKFSYLFNL